MKSQLLLPLSYRRVKDVSRKVKESNPRRCRRPGFRGRLPTAGRYLPLSGWPDLNRRPPHPECGALPSCATTRWSGRPDSNRRPPVPQTGALPSCATSRCVPPAGFEPATSTFVVSRAVHLRHRGVVFPLPDKDSNLDPRVQSAVSCRWTIREQCRRDRDGCSLCHPLWSCQGTQSGTARKSRPVPDLGWAASGCQQRLAGPPPLSADRLVRSTGAGHHDLAARHLPLRDV